MKKQFTKITTLALVFSSFAVFSQERVRPCATDEAMNKVLNNPKFKKEFDAAQAQLRKSAALNAGNKSAAAAFEYTVPVVFHVLYECNSSNVSDATLIQALKEVNDDYSRKAADTNLIATAFKNSFIPADIKFMLAKKDPFGNCTNGIVRHYDAKTNWDQNAADPNSFTGALYWSYTWDASKYLNIYIVSQIIDPSSVGITVGYTYRPGNFSSGKPFDAIVYNMNYLTGTKSVGAPNSRSLSHEIGHWLNLSHTWGGNNSPGQGCTGDDGIADTPLTKGEFGGCPSSTVSTCTQTNPAMVGLNNVQNIMNYSDCPRNFTSGQITEMRNTLANNVNNRNNLSTLPNLALTGVDGPGMCNPVPEFFSSNCSYTVCAGGSLTMKDLSNSSVTAVSWSADNGAVIASPAATLTSIMFPNAGTSNVVLSATNSQGTVTKSRAITVVDNTPAFGPVDFESFEIPGIPANWSVNNVNNDVITWEQTQAAAYDQSTSYMIKGLTNPGGNSDILQMPIMDVLNNQSNILEFAYAYRQSTSNQNDVLRIEGSKDCGGSWQTIYAMSANVMQNGSGGVGALDFVPEPYEWKTYVISSHPQWTQFKNSASVMVRFNFIQGTAGSGNNIYVDAINWYSTTGVNELTKSIRFNLYPNPTNGEASVGFNLNDPATVKLSVVDISGREVLPATEKNYPAGEQTITVNKNNTLAKGIYFVNFSCNGAKMSGKLVIN